jgi:hypothetical protein
MPNEGSEGEADRFHKGLVGIMGQAKLLGKKEQPGGVGMVQADGGTIQKHDGTLTLSANSLTRFYVYLNQM